MPEFSGSVLLLEVERVGPGQELVHLPLQNFVLSLLVGGVHHRPGRAVQHVSVFWVGTQAARVVPVDGCP